MSMGDVDFRHSLFKGQTELVFGSISIDDDDDDDDDDDVIVFGSLRGA